MTERTDLSSSREVTRRDPVNGTTELVSFRGPPGSRLFSCLYLPARKARGSVLICPSVHAEFTGSYRREVLLARRLADAGFAVGRFHYRGMGNSDGRGRDVTFDTMRDDARASLEYLRSESGADPVFLIGTRWGAMVAASTAAQVPGSSVVLWEPLLAASRFFKEAFRSMMIAELEAGISNPTTSEGYARRLRSGEAIDIVGHTIEPALYVSWVGRTLSEELGPVPRTILLVQIGSSDSVPRDLAEVSDRWRAAGFQVHLRTLRGERTWWLVDERWHDEGARPATRELISATTTWVEARTAALDTVEEVSP